MFKKIFSAFIGIALTVGQVQASAEGALKQAFDELAFTLSVEWDQKDLAFKETALTHFRGKLLEIQKSGVSDEEVLTFAFSQIKNQRLAEELKATLALNLAPQEMETALLNAIEKSSSTGANWASMSDEQLAITAILIIAIVPFILAFTVLRDKCWIEETGEEIPCE